MKKWRGQKVSEKVKRSESKWKSEEVRKHVKKWRGQKESEKGQKESEKEVRKQVKKSRGLKLSEKWRGLKSSAKVKSTEN